MYVYGVEIHGESCDIPSLEDLFPLLGGADPQGVLGILNPGILNRIPTHKTHISHPLTHPGQEESGEKSAGRPGASGDGGETRTGIGGVQRPRG